MFFPQQIFLLSFEAQLAFLVVNGGLEGDYAGCPLRPEIDNREHRIQGVAYINRFEKPAGLFDKSQEGITGHMGEDARPGNRLDQDLESVCQ